MNDIQGIQNAACDLFYILTKDYPPPWRLTYHRKEDWHERQHVSEILAFNGKTVISLETYTGDGDIFYLGSEGAEALIAFINKTHEILEDMKAGRCPNTPNTRGDDK